MEPSDTAPVKSGTGISMIESLKKGTAEMLVLSLLDEKNMPITEVIANMDERSGGRFTISGSYALFYRLERFEYIRDAGRKIADDGRRRQFYEITAAGRDYLLLLRRQYEDVSDAIRRIMAENPQGKEEPSVE